MKHEPIHPTLSRRHFLLAATAGAGALTGRSWPRRSQPPLLVEPAAAASSPAVTAPCLTTASVPAAAGVASTSPLTTAAASATSSATSPGGRPDGVLVLVLLAGGNDALNTVVPLGAGPYVDQRGSLALRADEVLPLDSLFALNAKLPTVKSMWDRGQVAVVHGVGLPAPDLSHFVTMNRVMRAWDGPDRAAIEGTGWLGRWLDTFADDHHLRAVAVGATVPLHLVGVRRRASAVATTAPEFGATAGTDTGALARAVHNLAAASSTSLSPWGAASSEAAAAALDDGGVLRAIYRTPIGGRPTTAAFVTAARLAGAGLGTRVVHVTLGEHDSHADQIDPHDRRRGVHQDRMSELDAGLAAFYRELDPAVAPRTSIVVFSEFGRTLAANASYGTDHGTAGVALVLGVGVRGGFHGEASSLRQLDDNGNPIATADLRSIFASTLDHWLGADSVEVLGRRFETFDLFR